MIKNMKISKKLISIFLISSIIICAIIVNVIMTYCDVNLSLKTVIHNNKEYNIYTDVIKLHTKANGYSNVLGFEMNNNLKVYQYPGPGVDMQMDSAKMQGYGNYVMKSDTSLFDFIEYCYSNNQGMVTACSLFGAETDFNHCNYNILLGYKGQTLNKNSQTYVDYFWNNMTAFLGETFNSYQDSYFFDRFTSKGAKLVFSLSNLSRWKDKIEDGSKEFLTCMTSYLFSMNPNSAPGAPDFEIKKGDIVPFLYVKEHTDDSDIKDNPRELAKYAYIALVNGWASCPNNNLWLEEFDYMYSYEEQEDLVEDLELLEEWYSDTETKYQEEKGKKGNNLLGSTIETIIKSDYSITQQLEATEYYLQNIEGIGDYKENMARNELMAKYMMENSHIGDIIEDYNVGINFITENLQRGTSETKNTHTAILSDFQVLEFEHTLDKDGHSDDDGISDKTELTNNIRWVDLTGMLEKTYNNRVANHETVKPTFAEQMEDLAYKNPGIFKYEGGRCLYKTYDYSSNPMLNDTDFDGLQDNIDSNKIDGKFKGSANNIGQVEYVSDFRYFFVDNNKYNDELSTMSLMMSNLANDNGTAPLHSGSQSISQYMQSLGFSTPLHKTSFKISDTENISGDLYLAKKTIQVGANKKTIKGYKDVYGVFLGGFDTIDNYKKLVNNFNKEEISGYYKCIAEDIVTYIKTLKPATNNDYCYWVCGYSIAGAIASEVAGMLNGDSEVYAYTFGSPNTNMESSGAGENIKNIINEDDLITKLYNKEEGLFRKGVSYNDSIFDNMISKYKKIIGRKYEAYPKRANSLKKAFQDITDSVLSDPLIERVLDGIANLLVQGTYIHDEMTFFNYKTLQTTFNASIDKIRQAHEIKTYYVLSKKLNGFDRNKRDAEWNEAEDVINSDAETNDSNTDNMDILNAIKDLGVWYVNHVITYQNDLRTNRGTTIAETYYNENKSRDKLPKDDNGNRLSDKDSETVIKKISDKKLGYFYEPFADFATSDDEKYKTDGTNRNYLKRYLGDDCTGITQGLIYTLSNGDRGQEGDDVNIESDKTGLWNHNVNADKLIDGSYDTDKSMMRLGWEKYYLDGTTWKKKKINNDGVIEVKTLEEVIGHKMSELGVNFLEPGDILCTSGHAEFYIGYEYTPTYNSRGDKKSGIKSLTLKGKATQGHSTFGWGNVQNEFPKQIYRFTYESDNTFRWRQGNDCDDKKYKVIWRKK